MRLTLGLVSLCLFAGPSIATGQPPAPPNSPVAPPKPPAVAVPVTRLAIKPDQVEVKRVNGKWVLTAGDVVLKEFGLHEREARTGQRLIQSLDLTEQIIVGGAQPTFEYYLSKGRPPYGFTGGVHLSQFKPDLLTLRADFNDWRIVENQRVLFHFGPHKDHAEFALAEIQKHRFNQMARIGLPGQGMTILLASDTPRATATTRPANLETRFPGAGPTDPRVEEKGPVVEFGKREPQAEDAVRRMPFDFRQVQLRKDGREWKLMIGNYAFMTFGERESVAREALKVIQHYQLTERCVLPDGDSAFEYFLVRGHAPKGRTIGQDATWFEPRSLVIRQTNGEWWLVHNEKKLLRFSTAEAARTALDIIRKHHFDYLCRIGGQTETGMMYFISSR